MIHIKLALIDIFHDEPLLQLLAAEYLFFLSLLPI